MINFTPRFYTRLSSELTPEQRVLTEQRLQEIYQGTRLIYKTAQDFEGCKRQLIILLTHIYQLNPNTLGLFVQYRDNVAKLEPTSGQNNIKVTLNSAKMNLEDALLNIEANHQKLNCSSLAHLTVSLCYSGAYSNIETALGFFRPPTLSFLISITKRQVLMNLAAEYLALVLSDRLPNNEIHEINSLYNYVVKDFGLHREEDHLATPFNEDMYVGFWSYARRKFSVSVFLSSFMQLLLLPPEAVIDNEENSEKLKEFFLSLGKADFSRDEYLQLYNEIEEQDGFKVSLHPKDNFHLRLSCLIACHLEQGGYLEQAYFKINDNLYFTDGSNLVIVGENGTFAALDEIRINEIISSGNCEPPILGLLAKQLSDAGLLLQAENRFMDQYYRVFCLKTLLERFQLIPRIVDEAYDFYKANRALFRTIGSEIFFTNNHALSSKKLSVLLDEIPLPTKKVILKNAIISGNDTHFILILTNKSVMTDESFIHLMIRYHRLSMLEHLVSLNARLSPTSLLAHVAAAYKKLDTLSFLQQMGADLNAVNDQNETLAIIAARKGWPELLIKLKELGVNLSFATPFSLAHIAAQQGFAEILKLLYEFNVDLNQKAKDRSGKSLAHFVVDNNRLSLLELLKSLGVDLDATDNTGRSAFFSALVHNNKEIFHELVRLGAQANKKDNRGNTLAHVVARQKVAIALEWLDLLLKLDVPCDEENNGGKKPVDLLRSQKIKTLWTQKIDEYVKKRKESSKLPENISLLGEKRALPNLNRFFKSEKQSKLNRASTPHLSSPGTP